MGLIDSISETNNKATNVGEQYLKSSYKYYKLKIFQQLTISVSMVFKSLIIGGLLLMCVLSCLVALGLFIGESTNNYPLGFVIVGLIFLALSVTTYALKHIIDKLIINKLSIKFFD